MSKLTETVVGKAEFVVTERAIHIELLLSRHAYLQLMLCPGICHDLPIVDTIGEGPVGDQSAEIVVRFVEESMAAILRKLDLFGGVIRVPCKVMEGVVAA